jgi:hypothetical protein
MIFNDELRKIMKEKIVVYFTIRGQFEKSVDWRQCAAVVQRKAVTVMPICSGGGNVVVA